MHDSQHINESVESLRWFYVKEKSVDINQWIDYKVKRFLDRSLCVFYLPVVN